VKEKKNTHIAAGPGRVQKENGFACKGFADWAWLIEESF
jgi:hypothetical protein